MTRLRLIAFVPSWDSPTETFVRANLRGLPFKIFAFYGDLFLFCHPLQTLYASSVYISKILYQIGFKKYGTFLPSFVAWILCKIYRPNVIIAEFGFHAIRMMNASSWSGIPLVVQFHGSDAFAKRRTTPDLLERYRRLFKIASRVIVKSQPMRDQLLRFGASPDQLVISPCGADSSLFYGASPGDASPLFIAVGRFVPKKAPILTIRAFAEACSLLPKDFARELRLLMVGDGPLLSASRSLVSDLNLEGQVSFLGLRSSVEVAELMRTGRAFVQHSMVAPDGDSEGSPVSVVEAQLSGLPVISTRHAGIPEVVVDGETGYLVGEGDVIGMAAFIARLAVDADLAAKLGRSGSIRARSSFTTQHHIDQVASVVNDVS